MIGIYKITSPTGKIYVGQSIDIKIRWYRYSKLCCKRQLKLYNSFKKHGVDNHKFEIIEECSIDNINERERYWQEYYNVIGENGLNLSLVSTFSKKYVHSKETRIKLSKNVSGENHPHFGKKFPKHVNDKKGRKGELSYWYGKKLDPKSTRLRQLKRSNKVKIIINDQEIIFECVMDCANYLGCTNKNILYRDKCRLLGKKSIGKYKHIYIEILK